MATLNPRSLANKLNNTCRRALEGAAGLCLSRTNYNVELEHWLLKLIEPADGDLPRLLKHYDVEVSRLSRELTRALDHLKTGNARAPELAPDIVDLMRETWTLSSLDYNASRIRSGYLLTALLNDRTLSPRIRSSCPSLAKLSGEQLGREVRALVAGTAEDQAEAAAAPMADGAPAAAP